MRRRKVLRARRWYSAFSREERAQLSRRRAPAPSKSAASPAATAERMPTIAPSSPSAASAIAPPANTPPVPLRSRLPSLRSSFVPPLVVSRFVSADGQSTSLRTRRTPVASSQTSQAANPRSPTKISAEPSAIARLPSPAASSRLPPTRPSRRCQAGVSPLACAARAAPMKVVPSVGSASANAAA